MFLQRDQDVKQNLLIGNSQREVIKTMKCPFDPSHIMPYERFLNHLQKCKYPDKKYYRKCKYNPYHVYHMDQLSTHQNQCPDSKKYQQDEEEWGAEEDNHKKPTNKSYDKDKSIVISTSQESKDYQNSQYSNIDVSFGWNNPKGRPLNKTNIEILDLQDFTASNKQKGKATDNKSRNIIQDLDDFNPRR